ncbi:hypothetical protein NL676_029310 [Syzygium grande]|nr:hypothetical protein NL676_029310 [Syzygium grande]
MKCERISRRRYREKQSSQERSQDMEVRWYGEASLNHQLDMAQNCCRGGCLTTAPNRKVGSHVKSDHVIRVHANPTHPKPSIDAGGSRDFKVRDASVPRAPRRARKTSPRTNPA